LTDARKRLRVAEFSRDLLVNFVNRVNGRTPLLARDSLRVAREKDRLAVRLALHALIDAWQEPAVPNRFARVRVFPAAGQHYKAWQILVLSAQAVIDP